MQCYVFDLDGTLADCSHRLWHIQKTPKDWREFFAACGDDALIEPVAKLYDDLNQVGIARVILSGRSDEVRNETEIWLNHHGLTPNALYMRNEGVHVDDHILKQEMLNLLLADGWQPILFVDDRKRVVDMWRSLGYVCLQAAPGDF